MSNYFLEVSLGTPGYQFTSFRVFGRTHNLKSISNTPKKVVSYSTKDKSWDWRRNRHEEELEKLINQFGIMELL